MYMQKHVHCTLRIYAGGRNLGDLRLSKETYYSGKRDLLEAKETYYRGKREVV
jgi:hypothetical protein